MVPTGGRTVRRQPVFVEVTAEGLIVHPDKHFYPVAEMDQENSPLGQFLSKTTLSSVHKSRQTECLLLLIRPNGAATYRQFRKYLLTNFSEKIVKEEVSPLGKLITTITK